MRLDLNTLLHIIVAACLVVYTVFWAPKPPEPEPTIYIDGAVAKRTG